MTPGTTAAGTDFLSSDYGRKYKKHSVSIFDSLYVNVLQEYSLRQSEPFLILALTMPTKQPITYR